ncbi:MAG: hypothetical protein ING40_04830 [Burkholderiales bacterium]|jgi:hypothetical protein|nr:hypothetical protein [Burkholderiales bacterium]MCA3228344.1 hypothetical protein [Burkholderiales bacterium]
MKQTLRLNNELRWLHRLTPVAQAQVLLQVAQAARLLHLESVGVTAGAGMAAELERALNNAMDAEPGCEAEAATVRLVDVLTRARDRGLRVQAEISEMEVDGLLGLTRLPVLSAVLGGSPVAA